MRRIAVVLSAAILAACAKKDAAPAADSAAVMPPPPAALNLADLAGTWQVQAMGEMSDSVLVSYQISATADTAGWTITLPNRAPMPLRVVTVAGDSIVFLSGPYESVLRPGVQVSTTSVVRLQDQQMVGRTTARYSVGSADSVLLLRTRGQRAP